MKKILRIIGIIFIGLFVLAAVLGVVAEKYDKKIGPKQAFYFLNSSDEDRTILFYPSTFSDEEMLNNEAWYEFNTKPGKTTFGKIFQNNYQYKIISSDSQKTIRHIRGFKVLENQEEDSYKYIYIDLGSQSYIALVNVNAYYGGGEIAQSMAAAVGSNADAPYIYKLYDGSKPIQLPDLIYTRDTLVLPGDKFPNKISYSELIYTLVAVPSTVKTVQEAQTYAVDYIGSIW
ncbi:hypothetical protein [Spirochaeta cellobiosiphila]|uniref:hypothetical protein n=1 Tax=Spirochaeta cellobiosiphila TaxID=504483 RepID=UPI000400DA97|nr:hypothetical protein [Spirochaeta cellobiosiphila]